MSKLDDILNEFKEAEGVPESGKPQIKALMLELTQTIADELTYEVFLSLEERAKLREIARKAVQDL